MDAACGYYSTVPLGEGGAGHNICLEQKAALG